MNEQPMSGVPWSMMLDSKVAPLLTKREHIANELSSVNPNN